MIKVIELYKLMTRNFTRNSNAIIKLKLVGDKKKYDINGFYAGYSIEYGNVIVVHTEYNDKPALTVGLLTQWLYEHKGSWNENTPLLYDNSVGCNLITGIKVNKTSVTLEVDIFKNEVNIN